MTSGSRPFFSNSDLSLKAENEINLLLLAFLDTDTEIIHGLFEPGRIEIKVNFLELSERPDVANVVVIFYFWLSIVLCRLVSLLWIIICHAL
jgi:hypothetical protein